MSIILFNGWVESWKKENLNLYHWIKKKLKQVKIIIKIKKWKREKKMWEEREGLNPKSSSLASCSQIILEPTWI